MAAPSVYSAKVTVRSLIAEPIQGWEQWARDIEDIVNLCERHQALERVQERNRELLSSLSRERQELYRELGQCFARRREALEQRPVEQRPRKRRTQASSNATNLPQREKEDA